VVNDSLERTKQDDSKSSSDHGEKSREKQLICQCGGQPSEKCETIAAAEQILAQTSSLIKPSAALLYICNSDKCFTGREQSVKLTTTRKWPFALEVMGFTDLPPDLEELVGLVAECIVDREEGNEVKHNMLHGKWIRPDFRVYEAMY
jgi:hypothetical protein